MDYLVELGYLGLFLGSFIAATLVPLSSEGILIGLVYAGFDVYVCVGLATLGNWLGSLSSFWLGYAGRMDIVEKWLKIKEEKVKTWEPRVRKYATLMALLSWLPFIGDVMSVALGFFRCTFWKMAFFIFVGKLARYVFWGVLTFMILKK
jgi:membrane protein YqaA with SNARE-associated domain